MTALRNGFYMPPPACHKARILPLCARSVTRTTTMAEILPPAIRAAAHWRFRFMYFPHDFEMPGMQRTARSKRKNSTRATIESDSIQGVALLKLFAADAMSAEKQRAAQAFPRNLRIFGRLQQPTCPNSLRTVNS